MNNSLKKEENNSEKGEITGFTPGPWLLETIETSIGSCHKIGSFPKNTQGDKTYACVYADNVRIYEYENLQSKIGKELLANARLIASAPTMYAELKSLHEENEKLKAALEPFGKMFMELTEQKIRQGGIVFKFNDAAINVSDLFAASFLTKQTP